MAIQYISERTDCGGGGVKEMVGTGSRGLNLPRREQDILKLSE
jgi:hypothetical protein